MAGPILIFFTLFWSAFTLFFDGLMGNGFYKQWESQHFVSTTGTVTYSQVRTHHGSKGGVSYSADIEYNYTVSGLMYSGDRLRFSHVSSSGEVDAFNMVNAHPAGSPVQVYYDPNNPNESLLFPGITGADFMPVLFVTPFNLAMIGFMIGTWGWMRERIYKPIAGGVKIIEEGMTTRVRLPQVAALFYGMITTGVLAFLSIFIAGLGTDMQPSMFLIWSAIFIAYAAGAGVYFWQQQKINSGIDDLVINEGTRTMELPLTYGRKERVTVEIANIRSLWVDVIEHRNSKGGTTYSYAPTISTRGGDNLDKQKLADWGDKLKADQFTEWLGNKIGVTGTPAGDGRTWLP